MLSQCGHLLLEVWHDRVREGLKMLFSLLDLIHQVVLHLLSLFQLVVFHLLLGFEFGYFSFYRVVVIVSLVL